jgi:hypothetical protein
MQKLFRSLIAVGGLAGLVACGDDVTVTEPTPPFTITGAPVTAVQVGQTVQLQASEAATWQSSNASVATVDGSGLVTAVGAGTASITATSTADVDKKASVTITVTAPAVRNVTVAPANAVLRPGETLGLVANVDADPGVARTVTWTSSNNAVATVTAAGVVTAVTPGAVTITATSTANTSVSGAAAITVRPPVPATISVQNITITGTAGQTANVNNIAGSIDVNLNVDPGEQVVTSVDVLIDGQVACSQNLSSAQSEAMRIAAAFEDIEDVIVSCQVNSADFEAATGIALYPNGPHTLQAVANIQGGSDVATPSTPLIFNNQSGVVAVVTTNNGSDPASAINPATGLVWRGGAVTIDVTGVSYVAGTTVSSVTLNLFGKTFTLALTNGKGSVTWTEGSSNWSPTNTSVTNYLSAGAENVTFAAAVLSNGQPLVSSTPLLNFGAPGTTNAAMPALDVIRLDNTAPGVDAANGPVQPDITISTTALGVWVNAATTFGAGTVGIPSTSTLNTTDIGSDAVVVEVFVGPTLTGASGSCNLTGLTAVTAASALAETIVSTAYRGRVAFEDGLGNVACADLAPGGVVSATFGADFTPPSNVTLTFSDGSTNNFFYNAVSPAVTYILASTGDNASGISATTPGLVSILRNNSVGANTCVVGTGSACAQVAAAAIANITGGSAGEGYYNLTAQLSDVAGNPAPTPAFTRLYLVDATAPAFTGNVGMNAQYAGNAPATFTNLNVTDNLDLNQLYGVVEYTALGASPIGLQYPSQTLGTFGLPLEKAFSGNYTIPSLIRCINAANTFTANAASEAQQITFTASDQAGNTGTVAPVAGALLAALDNCGAVGNLVAPAAINTFNDVAPVYPGTGKTQVSKSGSTSGANAASVTLSAVADVTLDNAPEPFTRVEFYYQNAAGNWVLIGQSGPGSLNQTVTNRTWTYTFSWDPDATVPTNATTNVIALGIDAQGDAVRTAGVVVNVAN